MVLRQVSGNKAAAAKQLGISPPVAVSLARSPRHPAVNHVTPVTSRQLRVAIRRVAKLSHTPHGTEIAGDALTVASVRRPFKEALQCTAIWLLPSSDA